MTTSGKTATLKNRLLPFRSYPSYRQTDASWFSEIPAHWTTKRLRLLFKIINGSTPRSEEAGYWDGDIPWVTPDDLGKLPERVLKETARRITRAGYENSGTTIVPPGSLVLSTRAPIGYVAVAAVELCTNQGCRSLVFLGDDSSDYMYFQMVAARPILESLGDGSTFMELAPGKLKELDLVVPPAPEQQKIALFLDHEAAKIDALIAKKERLIELLQEKRTALITHAVTKGLNPNVPMKDSGVVWLGQIPPHWEVSPLYSRYEVALGKMLDSKRISGEHLAPYLRNVDVQWDRVNIDGLPEMDFGSNDRARYSLQLGDLLVCEGGEVGRTAIWREELPECYYQKAIHRLRPLTQEDLPRFFFYVMYANAKGGRFVAGANPNTIDHLTAVQLKRHRFVFPPRREQVAIFEFLDRETAKVDSLSNMVGKGIDRLKEYRTALISAAVTGKIDVRGEFLGD